MDLTQLYELITVVVSLGSVLSASVRLGESSAVEWWGDERAESAPDLGFYDVLLDENACEGGEIVADAVGDFAFLGSLLSSAAAAASADCVVACHETPACASANFYAAGAFGTEPHCELLAESQETNPAWMRFYPGATHYSRTRCVTQADEAEKRRDLDAKSYFLKDLFQKLNAKFAKS